MACDYSMRVAITREISPSIERCELTHLSRQAIDVSKARAQHEAHEQRLSQAGCSIVRLPSADDLPDSVFIEDVAVVFDELAVVARPGAPSRRGETACVAEALQALSSAAAHRGARHSGRRGCADSRQAGICRRVAANEQGCNLPAGSNPPTATAIGYATSQLAGACTSSRAVTALSDNLLLINRAWVPADQFRLFRLVEVDGSEPYAANALRIGDRVIYLTGYPAPENDSRQPG